MQNKIVTGYRHTGIIVADMEKSLHFYRDLLGLEVIQDFTDSSQYINTITGLKNGTAHFIKLKTADGIVIELLEYLTHPTKFVKQKIYNVGLCHLALRVDNIKKSYQSLMKKGIKFVSPPVLSSEGIAKVCFCFDPTGIRVELVEMLNDK